MNQDYYHYIMQFHQKQLKIDRVNNALHAMPPYRTPLRKRFLLTMSDALLGLGQWIRPAEFQVSQPQDSAFEIKTGGC